MRITNIAAVTHGWRFGAAIRQMTQSFLKNPAKMNLPSRLRVTPQKGLVYLCDSPGGIKIFLKTKFKRDVSISIIYENDKIFAELQAIQKDLKRTEIFLVKSGEYISTGHLDPIQKGMYLKPKCLSKTPGHRVEEWLKNMNDLPYPFMTKVGYDGRTQVCTYNAEPVILRLDPKFTGEEAIISFEEDREGDEKLKWIIMDLKGLRFEFGLKCNEARCHIKEIWDPYPVSNTDSFRGKSHLLVSFLRFQN